MDVGSIRSQQWWAVELERPCLIVPETPRGEFSCLSAREGGMDEGMDCQEYQSTLEVMSPD